MLFLQKQGSLYKVWGIDLKNTNQRWKNGGNKKLA